MTDGRTRYVDLKPTGEIARLPDPRGLRYERLLFYVRVADLDRAIPKDPNPRYQKTVGRVATDIANAVSDPNNKYFHIGNKGILIIAHTVERTANGKLRLHIPVTVEASFGLADGGTTYDMIMQQLAKVLAADVVGDQYVTVEVLANLHEGRSGFDNLAVLNPIAAARNNSVQVKETSLRDHRGEFDFIKEAVLGTKFADKIIYCENEPGVVDVKDLITVLTLLNSSIVPENREFHGPNIFGQPTNLMTNVWAKNMDTYRKFHKLIPSILRLHDYIGANAARLTRLEYKRFRMGGDTNNRIFEGKTPWNTSLTPYTGEKAEYYPAKSVWFSMLGAYRQFIVERNGEFVWTEKFDDLKKRFEVAGGKMIKRAQELNVDILDTDKMGKKVFIWEYMYNTLKYQ